MGDPLKTYSVSAAYRKCQPDDFHCSPEQKSQCLPKEKKCDGYFDCRNKADEADCGPNHGTSCSLDQFRCAKGQRCVDQTAKCNHRDDCGDNSDEKDCSECRRKIVLITQHFFEVDQFVNNGRAYIKRHVHK